MKPIPGYEGRYSIDEDGRVWSHISGIFLGPDTHKDGRKLVELYAVGKSKKLQISRLMGLTFLGMKPEQEIDHKDRDKGNDTLGNLRIATVSQNNANRGRPKNNKSGFKGVSWRRTAKKWAAHIKRAPDRQRLIGLFDRPEDAAAAYDAEARRLFGEFAATNGAN